MDAEAVGGANICRLQVGDFELDATQGKTDARGSVRVTIRPERVQLETQDDNRPEPRPRAWSNGSSTSATPCR